MVNVLGAEIPIGLPTTGSGGLWEVYTYMALFFVLCIFVAIGIWLWTQHRLYNKKIIILENSGEGFRVVGRDKGRLIKIGDGGEEVLFLKRRKVFRSAYGRKMGKNEYWFSIGQDGYWYNCLLGDLDAKMGMLDIEPIDRDMRYMHVALRKNAQERYNKQNFMDKYGSYIFNGLLIFIFFLGMYFLVDKIGELITSANSVLSASQSSIEPMQQALARVDQICSGGSGITSA